MAVYMMISGAIFLTVGLLHFVRLIKEAPVYIGGAVLPMWVSWIGLFVTLALGIWGIVMGIRICS
ncbi:MAG: hypothetical protein IH624_06620 [Phycisphaerae bacterium]|nr:hypothetical protein [Phycisphaerae bacterium]